LKRDVKTTEMKRPCGAIIQNRKIKEYTANDFWAIYKSHSIEISTDHGHGDPDDEDKKRFNIDVRHENGMVAVQTYEDFDCIEEAIDEAIHGAMLSPNKPND
jgi:hypothetical protein